MTISRLYNKDYDIPNQELDFYFRDVMGSTWKIFISCGIEWEEAGWTVEEFEEELDILVTKLPSVEKWTLKHDVKTNESFFGLRFKTAKDKLAFTLKYL
jgi:hypothetical protein